MHPISCLALLDLVLYFLGHLLQQNFWPPCTSITYLFSTLVLRQCQQQMGQIFAPRGAEGFSREPYLHKSNCVRVSSVWGSSLSLLLGVVWRSPLPSLLSLGGADLSLFPLGGLCSPPKSLPAVSSSSLQSLGAKGSLCPCSPSAQLVAWFFL